jgi:SIR2-like domain
MTEQGRRLVDSLPEPLKAELLAGRWLPIVGAGLSLGASVPHGGRLPKWDELGKSLGADLPPSYRQGGSVEMISAYEHAYGRAQMTARVSRALHLGSASPGPTQLAFARLSFEHVVTTNVEQLLEESYRNVRGAVYTVIEDGQLRMRNPYAAPTVVKLHGDLHRPASLVLTEDDYDRVPSTRPLMLIWLTGQLITKTGVLIGYSLDDPDMRALLAELRDRLGVLPPDLWVITVGEDPVATDRYRRRGIRVASLPDPDHEGWGLLEPLFTQLHDFWIEGTRGQLTGSTSVVDAALKAGAPIDTVILFEVDASRLSLYSDYVYPALLNAGLLPVSRADVSATEGFELAALDSLLRVAGQVVVEADRWDAPAAVRALRAVGHDKVLLVGSTSTNGSDLSALGAAASPAEWEEFGDRMARALTHRREDRPRRSTEQRQDLRTRTLTSIIELESSLRAIPGEPVDMKEHGRTGQPLRDLLAVAVDDGWISGMTDQQIVLVVNVRNALVHSREADEKDVESVNSLVQAALSELQDNDALIHPEISDEPPVDSVAAMLAEFERVRPSAQHRLVAERLSELGYEALLPRTSQGVIRPYIRWLYSGRRRVTLYQVEYGIVLDSKIYFARAAVLPGAQARGRRVIFSYDVAGLEQSVEAAASLRDLANN